ncbi:F-box only protein 31 [Frankliniella fusca]|uniref:F-box only protein 31 n=1 Tax=Frankliniella fusca TaxID=407009 RepID=A0AAE1GUC6_9NEOP|nr:F-box only protein 31 [Frankliniella fusca]
MASRPTLVCLRLAAGRGRSRVHQQQMQQQQQQLQLAGTQFLASLQLASQFSAQFASQIACQLACFNPQLALQLATQIVAHQMAAAQLSPQFAPQLSPQPSQRFTPQLSPQLASQLAPQLSSQLGPQLSPRLAPYLSPQFGPPFASQHTQPFVSQLNHLNQPQPQPQPHSLPPLLPALPSRQPSGQQRTQSCESSDHSRSCSRSLALGPRRSRSRSRRSANRSRIRGASPRGAGVSGVGARGVGASGAGGTHPAVDQLSPARDQGAGESGDDLRGEQRPQLLLPKLLPWMRQRRKQPNTAKKKNRLRRQAGREAHPQPQQGSAAATAGPGSAVGLEATSTSGSLSQWVCLSLSITDTPEWHCARLQEAWGQHGPARRRPALCGAAATPVARATPGAVDVAPPVEAAESAGAGAQPDGLLYRVRPASAPAPAPAPRAPGFVVVVQLSGGARGVAVYLGLVLDSHARVWSSDDWAVTAACLARSDPAVPCCPLVASPSPSPVLPAVRDEAAELARSSMLALRLLVDGWLDSDSTAATLELAVSPVVQDEWSRQPRDLSAPYPDEDDEPPSPAEARSRSVGGDLPPAAKIPRRTRSLGASVREAREARPSNDDTSRSPSPPLPAAERASSLSVPGGGVAAEERRAWPCRHKTRARSILTGHGPHPSHPPGIFSDVGGDAVASACVTACVASGERLKRRAKRRKTDCRASGGGGGTPLLLALDGYEAPDLDKASCSVQ